MARLNVIANYNCDTKTFDQRNVFSIQGVWDCPPIVSCFYGTLGLMSGFMNRNGAYPGIKSVCPLTLVVDGASDHLTTLAQKIGALDSDSVYTMFLDESTIGFMLTMEEVFRVNIVINRVGEGFEKGKLFLPQLLMSAEAAKCAFEEIKAKFSTEGVENSIKCDLPSKLQK